MNIEKILKTENPIPLQSRTIIHLMLVNNCINEAIGNTLKSFDVSPQQFNVLRILRGQKGNPANLSTINERMITKMSNTTRLVDKLLSKGFVDRIVCPSNRRKIEITITEKGKQVLKKMDGEIIKTEHALVKDFDPKELEKLNELLHKF